jgi:putative sugar O-methyltransferase
MLQVSDSIESLELMLKEQKLADPIFHTTNYWEHYERRLLPYLRIHGLKDFRSGNYPIGGEVMDAFKADDALPQSDIPIIVRAVAKTLRLSGFKHTATKLRNNFSRVMYGRELEKYRDSILNYTLSSPIGSGAKQISEFDVSLIGNPTDTFSRDGKTYTSKALYYYLRYAYVSRHLNFSKISTVVELSSGSGKQAEILGKLHPNLTIMLFDIPPQLYVAQQYLSAVFGERVVPFDSETHRNPNWKPVSGKIYLLGNWQINIIKNIEVDLFWSAASLGEMEPAVVDYYLRVASIKSQNIYLMQKMNGKEIAKSINEIGVMQQVVFENYSRGLVGMKLLNRSPAYEPNKKLVGDGYEDAFWTANKN